MLSLLRVLLGAAGHFLGSADDELLLDQAALLGGMQSEVLVVQSSFRGPAVIIETAHVIPGLVLFFLVCGLG